MASGREGIFLEKERYKCPPLMMACLNMATSKSGLTEEAQVGQGQSIK